MNSRLAVRAMSASSETPGQDEIYHEIRRMSRTKLVRGAPPKPTETPPSADFSARIAPIANPFIKERPGRFGGQQAEIDLRRHAQVAVHLAALVPHRHCAYQRVIR